MCYGNKITVTDILHVIKYFCPYWTLLFLCGWQIYIILTLEVFFFYLKLKLFGSPGIAGGLLYIQFKRRI